MPCGRACSKPSLGQLGRAGRLDAWTVGIAESNTGERPKDASVAAGIATALFGGLEAKHRLFELNFQRSPSSLGLSRPNWLPMDLLREVEPEELDRWVAAVRSKDQLDVFGEAAIESVLARLGTQQARHTLIDEATAGVESPALFARLIEDPQLTSPLGVLANRTIPPGPGPAPARVANAKKAAYAASCASAPTRASSWSSTASPSGAVATARVPRTPASRARRSPSSSPRSWASWHRSHLAPTPTPASTTTSTAPPPRSPA